MSERMDLDTELMLRFQSGDVSCFEKLVERHKQRVFNLIYRFLGGREDVEDLAQEVFLRVYRAGPDYRPSARFTTWLYVIARNVCLKAVEKSRHEVAARRDDAQFALEARARRQTDEQDANPLNAAMRDERARMVQDAVTGLPEAQRMAVILYRYQHLDYEEIATIMKTSTGAIKSLLHRAKVALKEKLAGYLEKSRNPAIPSGLNSQESVDL